MDKHKPNRKKLARAVYQCVNRRAEMPLLLEVGLLVEDGWGTLSEMGYDPTDPRIVRNVRMAVSIYNTAIDRKRAKKKSDWDKENQEGKKLLDWASGIDDENDPNGPQMPKRNR